MQEFLILDLSSLHPYDKPCSETHCSAMLYTARQLLTTDRQLLMVVGPQFGQLGFGSHLLGKSQDGLAQRVQGARGLAVGVRPRIPTAGHMGYAFRGGLARKKEPCGARFYSVTPARHGEDILKMLRDLIGYVWSHVSCNLLLLSGYLSDLTDL
jgi:hypothetical protein